MTSVWHLARYDLHRFWWAAVAWWIYLVGLFWMVTPGLGVFERAPKASLGLQSYLDVLYLLLQIVLVVFVIQADRPSGINGFWLTRPIGPCSMLASKLAFLVLVVLLPAVGLEALAFWHMGLAPLGMVLGLCEAVVFELAWILSIALLAALTSSLARFFIVSVIVFYTAMPLAWSLFGIWFLSSGGASLPALARAVAASRELTLVGLVALLVTGLLVHAFIGRGRHAAMAACLAFAILVVGKDLVAPWQLPGWMMASKVDPDLFELTLKPPGSQFRVTSHQPGDRLLRARLELARGPGGYWLEIVDLESDLQVSSFRTRSRMRDLSGFESLDGKLGVEAAAAWAAGGAAVGLYEQKKSVELRVSPIKASELVNLAQEPVQLRARGTFGAYASRVAMRSRLEPGASASGLGRTIGVLAVGTDAANGWNLEVGYWETWLDMALLPARRCDHPFVHVSALGKTTGEQLLTLTEGGRWQPEGNRVRLVTRRPRLMVAQESRLFRLPDADPYQRQDPGEPVLPPNWREGAELLCVDSSLAATFTREIVAQAFTLEQFGRDSKKWNRQEEGLMEVGYQEEQAP